MIQKSVKAPVEYSKDNSRLKIAIVKSSYYGDLTKSLEKECIKHLIAYGVKKENIRTFQVPGSWEIPLLVKKIAKSKKFDAVVALGIIIKGETYHFELIANECARALMNISLKYDIPVVFEILATFNLEQAKARSIGKNNKGLEAAETVLETIKELSKL